MKGMTITLKPYQKECLHFLSQNKAALIADEAGLGKTIEVLAQFVATKKKRMLVVCPAYLKANWVSEIQTKLKAYTAVKTFKHLKEVAETEWHDLVFEDIVIINYEQISRAQGVFDWAQVVVVDESQLLKNDDTIRSIFFMANIAKYKPEQLILMSGTPMENRTPELYTTLKILAIADPEKYADFTKKYPSSWRFNEHFCYKQTYFVPTRGFGRRKVTKFTGLRHAEELKEYLHRSMIRRKAKDVLGAGETISKEVIVGTKNDKKLQAAWDSFKAESDGSVASQYKAQAAKVKAPHTIKYVQEALEGERVVIFSDHVDPCQIIAKALGCPCIDGSTPSAKRFEYVKLLNEGKIQYLVATIGSASTGLNMVGAHHMVFNDISWVPSKNEQARKRIDRIGQTEVCTYHYIQGTIQDAKILQATIEKQKTISEVFE